MVRKVRALVAAALLVVATSVALSATTAQPAQASDCAWTFCGYVVNASNTGLVAASLDKYGGYCPYPGGAYSHCGTCYVPAGYVSDPVCNSIFNDTDTFTYQYNSYIFRDQNKWYSANQYIYPHMPSYKYGYCWRDYSFYILMCQTYVQ